MSLDVLIETLVSDAQIRNGAPAEWLLARGMVARSAPQEAARRALPWTAEEEQFYLEQVGRLSYEEIAAALGRTVVAVRIHAKRRGLPAATRVPGYLTTNQVAKLLGVDNHYPAIWVDSGLLAGERLPFADRVTRRVSWLAFKMWLVRPTSWLYFDVRKIKNDRLRRLVELAQARWGDQWLDAKQAAAILGCHVELIHKQIGRGKLPGYRRIEMRNLNRAWSYWYVRRSDVESLQVGRGKGCPGLERVKWSERGDAFLRRALAEGKAYHEIARMMKWSGQRVRYRAKLLTKQQEGQ